jgi:hypothetical protein
MATFLKRSSKPIRTENDLANGLEDGFLLTVPPEAHTLAGFRAWALSDAVPEKLPLTFIRGKVYVDMSKEEIQTHALVKTGVGGVFFQLNEELDFGHIFINGVFVTNVRAKVSNNPDIVAVSYRRSKRAACAILRPKAESWKSKARPTPWWRS